MLGWFYENTFKRFCRELFKGRILNIHPSLLPKYKGLNTHARALASNEQFAGCSVHLVTSELDGGPILGSNSNFY